METKLIRDTFEFRITTDVFDTPSRTDVIAGSSPAAIDGSAVSLKCGGLASTGTMIAPVAITIVSFYVYIVPLLYFLIDVIDAISK